MKRPILILAACFIYLSCKKQIIETDVIIPAPASEQFTIQQVINDSTIVLKWSPFNGDFQKYLLVRTAAYIKDGQFLSYVEPVDSSSDINHVSFKEDKMPLASDIYYELFVSSDTSQYNRGFHRVGSVFYQRPNSLIHTGAKDVLIDKQKQWIYITGDNSITIADYTGKIIRSVDLPISIGYCSLGDFNGSKELYVPENDGWLLIFDAGTLELKDKIYIGGYYIGSVVAVNGKLYVSSSEMSAGLYANCTKVYDRDTKQLIGRTGHWDATRLIYLQGTSVEMIDLTINIAPVDLSWYQFDPSGVPIIEKEDQYHGDYYMDAAIARSFPDGSRFITSSSGTIFDKSLVFDRYLKQNGGFSDFAFNTDGSIIYAAYGFQKQIDAISYPGGVTVKSYSTSFYPYKIFRDGNSLICISKASSGQFGYLFVEKINL